VTDSSAAPGQGQASPQIDTSVPHSARIWNYWLGGKDNYPVDRAAGDQYREVFPEIVEVARASRQFLTRAVGYLAGEAGVRQFLDIGTGLPTAENTHEVAQRVAPESRIVYVDNDPVVLAHARALLTSSPQGVTQYVDADLRDPDRILEAAGKTLDFDQPVALVMLAMLHFVPDEDDPAALLGRYRCALSPGSHLIVNHGTSSPYTDRLRALYERGGVPLWWRGETELRELLAGFELVEPGIVRGPRWRLDPAEDRADPPDWWESSLTAVARLA
jgi:hypothetical protein